MNRPEFDSITDFDEFNKYYWYKDELIKICKAHGLLYNGSKIELNNVIEAYFSGRKILPAKKQSQQKNTAITVPIAAPISPYILINGILIKIFKIDINVYTTDLTRCLF